MSFLSSAFFVKNVPGWERALRIGIGLVGAAIGFAFLAAPWSWVVVVASFVEACTGVVGFCPMCALAGRRIARRAKVNA